MDYFQLILLTLATPFTLIWIYLAIAGGKKYQKYTDSSFAKEFQMSELLCVGFSVMRILHISTKTRSAQAKIREIHDYLLSHMDQRITIEGLCHLYPINPTTLKEVFKDVYGTSIAAHLKEHRMEKAARLLHETDASMAEVARRVGYESQSKFTAAFKDQYGCLPTMYRKMS